MNSISTLNTFIRGKCMSMCPEKEITMRERNGLLHQLESVQMGKSESVTGNRRTIKSRWRADYKRVIKSFSRPAAGHGPPDPDDIRPPQVLLQTVKYLLSEVVPSQSLPWNEVYDFVFDRLRAVRQDLVIQGTPSVESVEILEPIARFLAYAGYRSCEEPASLFDAVIHRRHLLECVQRLLVLYDRQEQESGGSATGCDGRADTEALYLVLAPGSADALQRALQLPAAYRSDTVKSALEFSLACYSGNYVRALRRLPLLPPLLACLAALHVPHLRRQALRVMSVAYSSRTLRYPTAVLADLFSAGSAAEVVDECRHYGLSADVDAGISFDKNRFDLSVRVRTPVRLKAVDRKLAAADVTKLLLGEPV
ncbi:SAC3 domain-containing protein 1 isoform X1 [Schistocerca nitens]|uniref:SAC3 domain-containing protein 1 isoform X1 n=1 Tax=Schistocerca nitens TaxID=7011 RepID=UPI002117D167|nr:SAC3 domain-containing protein 1 isoform X1 [Schistocerca nitens]